MTEILTFALQLFLYPFAVILGIGLGGFFAIGALDWLDEWHAQRGKEPLDRP